MSRVRSLALVSLLASAASPALAQSRRPTPHEAIERNLSPVTAALRELSVTDEERARIADLTERAEAWAADMVQAQHRRDNNTLRDRRRRIELLAAVLRARVDALRAEGIAVLRDRAVVAAVERRTQARAALERATEQRMILERGDDAVSTYRLPAPELTPAAPVAAPGASR